jgi:hypothetical protein
MKKEEEEEEEEKKKKKKKKKKTTNTGVKLKGIPTRNFGCTRYQVRGATFIFAEKLVLKHPWGKKLPVKTS